MGATRLCAAGAAGPGAEQLAELLFNDADDPLGALRWTLAELRRAIGNAALFRGDPVATALGDDVVADIQLIVGVNADTTAVLDIDGELLEGVEVDSSPAFETWLAIERHRLSSVVEARLREAAIGLVSIGRAQEAVAYAARAVAQSPLDEGNHELLVRSLAMSGDDAGAQRQVALCEDLLRRKLGIEVSTALRDAASTGTDSPMVASLGGRAAAESQLEAGNAAIGAGSVDAGLQCLRRAVAEAAHCHDDELHGRALAALGGALIHATRGRDEEGAVVLHEAIRLAIRSGDRATAARAQRELGYVEVHAGRRATAENWLTMAEELADSDKERAAILGVRGMNASDRGDYRGAFAHLAGSVELAERCGDQRQQAWSLSLIGRAHLLRGEHRDAGATLARSMELVREQRWIAFLPWPQTLQAELDLGSGDAECAADELEKAWALARQLNDPCWEGMAARGLGLLHAGRGNHDTATKWFVEAAVRSSRPTDRYQWVHAHVLDTMIMTALRQGDDERAGPLTANLATRAARCDMRELVVRAHLHRSRLGNPNSLQSARLIGADIDNPALAELLERSG